MESVAGFYRDTVAQKQIQFVGNETIKYIKPLQRIDFMVGMGLATTFLIVDIAIEIFYFLGTVLSLGLHEPFRSKLFSTGKDIAIEMGSILVGFMGIAFPKLTNESILDLSEKRVNIGKLKPGEPIISGLRL